MSIPAVLFRGFLRADVSVRKGQDTALKSELSLGCGENCYSDEAAAFVVQEDTVITHLAVGRARFLLKMEVEHIRLFIIV